MKKISRFLTKNTVEFLLISLLILFIIYHFILKKLFYTGEDNGIFSSNYEELTLIISLLTIFFLYKAYKSTIIQNEQQNFESSLHLIDQQINSFTYANKLGVDAINSLDIDKEKSFNYHYYNQIILIITLFEGHFFQLKHSNILPEKSMEDKYLQAYTLFYSKILWPFYDAIKGEYQKFFHDNIEKKLHDDFGFTILRFSSLSHKCLHYLAGKGHIEINSEFKKEVLGILGEIEKDHGNKKIV